MELFKKTDPLVKIFLEKYGMNLLSIPREDISVGDLYVYNTNNKAMSTKGSIVFFLTPKPKIPKLTIGASMADVTATMTKEIDFNIGLNLVSGFLEKFGVGSLFGNIKAAYEAKGAKTIKFNFPNATKDSVDAMEMGQNLIKTKPIPHHPFYSKDNRYFLVMAVARASAFAITVQDKSKNNADIDLSAMNQKIVETKAKIDKDNNSAITFNGSKNLGFAVELQELSYDGEEKTIKLNPANVDTTLKGGTHKGKAAIIKKQPGLEEPFINIE